MLDLLIKNGHVIDPANRTDQVGNIAIYNGRITRYEEGEPASGGRRGKICFSRTD